MVGVSFEDDKLHIEDGDVRQQVLKKLDMMQRYVWKRKLEIEQLLQDQVEVKLFCNMTPRGETIKLKGESNG